jgi:hypothetical protein
VSPRTSSRREDAREFLSASAPGGSGVPVGGGVHEASSVGAATPPKYPCIGCGIETDETRLFCCGACLSRWRGWRAWAPGDRVCLHLNAEALDAAAREFA